MAFLKKRSGLPAGVGDGVFPTPTPVGGVPPVPVSSATTGYVFVLGAPALLTVAQVMIDGVVSNDALLGATSAGVADGAGQSLALRVPPGRRVITISLTSGESASIDVTVPSSDASVAFEWATSSSAPRVHPLSVNWSDFVLSSSVLLLDGVPAGTDIFIDDRRITGDRSTIGQWVGWVGGGGSGVGVIRDVPQGTHTVITGPVGGLRKTFRGVSIQPSMETIGRRFSMLDGSAQGINVTRVRWDQQAFDEGSVVGGGGTSEEPPAASGSFTMSASPPTVDTRVGDPVYAVFEIRTSRVDSGTSPLPVSLSVSGSASGMSDLAALGLQATFDRPSINAGESATLTVTGPAPAAMSTARLYVKAQGAGAPSTPIALEIHVIEARLATQDDSKPSGPSTAVIFGVLAAVAAVAFVAVSASSSSEETPRSNPSRRPRKSRRGR